MIFSILISFVGLFLCCHAETNLALGKAYKLSVKPNYALSALSSDTTSLTDGKYALGHFWTNINTVGWQAKSKIEILIDLKKSSYISSIVLSTVRGEYAEVYYPAHIYAFIGIDLEHFLYVGDISASTDNTPGSYQAKKFVLENIDSRCRYVLLEVAPMGYYFFCDEIEITEGGVKNNKTGMLDISKAREYSKRIEKIDSERYLLRSLIDKLRVDVIGKDVLINRLRDIEKMVMAESVLNNFKKIETDILRLHRDIIHTQYPGKQLIVESVDNGYSLSPIHKPSPVASLSLSLMVPQYGYDQKSFVITNVSEDSMRVTITVDNMPKESIDLSCYHIPFVKAGSLITNGSKQYVADPLVPINKGITLRSGEPRMVLVTAYGKKAGKWKDNIKIIGLDTKYSLPFNIDVSVLKLPNTFTINTVNWCYLDSKSIVNRQMEIVKNLNEHHINVVVVPPGLLPLADQVIDSDFIQIETYLKLYRNVSKVMIYMAYNWDERRLTCNGKCKFMDDEWKARFKRIYEQIIITAGKAGFSKNQIYLYPYDEMNGEYIEQFIALASWARREIQGIQFYATLESIESLKSIPFLDIAQVINRNDRINNLGLHKAEIWLYDAQGPAKSLSPYSYYRLMPWEAYLYDYKGAGFWNYSSFKGWGEFPFNIVWDDIDGKGDPYAVIYEGNKGDIISSRRWDAWRMGVEDYELLTMYGKVKGITEAKKLCKKVMDDPSDCSRADNIRRQILQELSN